MIDGIEYFHKKKILHRDLKTSNIMLDKKWNIKIGDFGISRILENTTEHAKTFIGTLQYMSPEMCLNKPYSY